MIVLDTSVISEPLKPRPDPVVVEWLDRQSLETLFVSAISLAELRYGVATLPKGKRRDGLSSGLAVGIMTLFEGRILPFNTEAADAYAEVRAQAWRSGKAIGATDGYIAATAAAHGFAVATRDTTPFVAAGVAVINPWLKN